jgi:hypothetical protein
LGKSVLDKPNMGVFKKLLEVKTERFHDEVFLDKPSMGLFKKLK